MANYVYNRILCYKKTYEELFLDDNPCGDGHWNDEPYLTFNKILGISSMYEEQFHPGGNLYYGYGFNVETKEDDVEIRVSTKSNYPIAAIVNAINKSHDVVWYAVEENYYYTSIFYWLDGVKEDIYILDSGFDEYINQCLEDDVQVKNYDDYIWYYDKWHLLLHCRWHNNENEIMDTYGKGYDVGHFNRFWK